MIEGAADLVAAAMDGEALLVADAEGRLFRGDTTGFERWGEAPFAPRALAWWRGRLWLGGGARGLWVREGGAAAVVRADRPCRDLDARGDLVVGCDDVLCATADGARFPATGRGLLDRVIGD